MGVAYFIAVEDRPPNFDTSVDGKRLAQAAERLGRIAEALGVAPLESFFSASPEDLAALLDDEPADRPPQLVARLGLRREPGFLYYVEGGQVKRQRQKRPGQPPFPVESVADLGFTQDGRSTYFVDEKGDVCRSPPPDAGEPSGGPAEAWFDPAEGLATVRALRAQLTGERDAELSAELARFEAILQEAARRRLRFHLAIDI